MDIAANLADSVSLRYLSSIDDNPKREEILWMKNINTISRFLPLAYNVDLLSFKEFGDISGSIELGPVLVRFSSLFFFIREDKMAGPEEEDGRSQFPHRTNAVEMRTFLKIQDNKASFWIVSSFALNRRFVHHFNIERNESC